jgi:signal transduction histidine kinase
MKLLDLSLRYKLPIWGGMLIVITALAVTGALLVGAYDELEEDLHVDSQVLGRTLAENLFPTMLHNDVWRAIEIINAPVKHPSEESLVKAENIVVVDKTLHVFAATHPAIAPLGAALHGLNDEYAVVADHAALLDGNDTQVVELPKSPHLYFLTPIADEGYRIGTVIIMSSKSMVMPRFFAIAWRGILVGALILAVLLPINWYWGRRMTKPLVQLTARMESLGNRLPTELDSDLYAHQDELGQLFEAYHQMVRALQSKGALEEQMVQSERMAALGHLAAGVAHEINNPLGGMLMAIDTLKCHSDTDPHTLKTITLIERGLTQIKETVGALLVEARVKSRSLSPQDLDDVHTLVAPQVRKKALRITWRNGIDREVAVPASQVRQIIINLLLNAIEAARQEGDVGIDIDVVDQQLRLSVSNDGKILTAEQMKRLFEPFSSLSEGGHGLGLWVTYQIVHQLGGDIVARSDDGYMRFAVVIPVGGAG